MEKQKSKMKLNLQLKLVTSMTAFLLVIGAVSTYILIFLNDSRIYAKVSSRETLPQTLEAIDLKFNIQEIQLKFTDALVNQKRNRHAMVLKATEDNYKIATAIVNKLLRIHKDKENEENVKNLNEIKNSLKKFYKMGSSMINTYGRFGTTAGNDLKTVFDLLGKNLKKSLDVFVNNQRKELNDSFFNISENSLEAQMNMGQGLIGIVSVGFLILVYLYNTIIIPLRKTVAMVEDIAEGEGDLSVRLEINSSDELGELADHFNIFVSKIQEIVKKIISISENLAASAVEMSASTVTFSDHSQNQAASAEEITATVEEISAGIDTIADMANSQYSGLTGLLSNIKNLSGSISEMSGIVSNAGQQADKIQSEATEGQSSLKEMNTSIMNIEQSSGEMKNIVSMINDISEQINLLSLNAAIESARAGEAGRGFAVVSEEISKLADQTAKSINEIDSLIKMNSREIANGTRIVENSIEKLQHIMREVETINIMMMDISNHMIDQLGMSGMVDKEADRVKDLSDEIKASTEEQKVASNEIVKSISSINELIQKSASGAEEFAGSAEELSGLAEALRARVSMFKV